MLFDTHAHIDDNRFDNDRDEVLQRAAEAGVSLILNAGACMESSARAVDLAARYPAVYAAVGVHPHDAKDVVVSDYQQLADWHLLSKVVAVGEIGLDYYYDHSPREVQKEVFIRHIDLARQLGKPIIIHDRDAHGDVMDIVKREGQGVNGVFHCFSGSLEMMREVIKMGFYVSIAGPVTIKSAVKLKEVAAAVPLERLLVETDCPYLTPNPYRGRRNEPAYVRYVAEEVARLRNMDLEELATTAAENGKRLFGIPEEQ
ncbi:MAG TPA: TatD family hydrolase [Patescibacteria group bacterium]|nr:TatD family hydrolase [Patescibacteria group bacterium]